MELIVSTPSHEDWVLLFWEIYLEKATTSPPILDELYETFQLKWLAETTEFLLSNRSVWKLTDEDVEFLEEKLPMLGFHCPSFDQIHSLANTDSLVYRTFNNILINGSVVSVW
jgi:hypothetical protein